MLVRLRVENLAVIEAAEVEFEAGLNVITGETGAGKSVLMGALSLSLGARADASAVREGAKEARIEAEFDVTNVPAIAPILAALELPPCEEGVLLIRRTISAMGSGRIRVNEASTTVQTLKQLGRQLMAVHGPNDNWTLAEEAVQRDLLDAYAGLSASSAKNPASHYAACWQKYSACRRALDEINNDSTEGIEEEIDHLRYATEELTEAHLKESDETELPARHAAQAHVADFMESASAATQALGGDEGASVLSLLANARENLMRAAKYNPAAEAWLDTLSEVQISVQELSRDIADAFSNVDNDPHVFEELEERLSLIQNLKRKYHCASVADLLELREKRLARLNDLESRTTRLEKLSQECAQLEEAVREAGQKLSAARMKAADKFSKAVTRELKGLGFLQADFSVSRVEASPSSSGVDAIAFQFAPNPGESARPLAEIASSGEIARVMLAVKSVAAEHDATPVLVFDEMDSNIGGETGLAVGSRLRAVAKHHQVIAISHLAQTAAYAENHLVVSKSVSQGRTRTAIHPVAGEARCAEIARMLGGADLTSVVTAHARELLARAAKTQNGE